MKRKHNLSTSEYIEKPIIEKGRVFASGALCSDSLNDNSFTISSVDTNTPSTMGITNWTSNSDLSKGTTKQQELQIKRDIIDFIASKGELKRILDKIIEKISKLFFGREDNGKIIFEKDKLSENINVNIYVVGKTNGLLIDLMNDINSLIFDEAIKIEDSSERGLVLNLFNIKILDLKNGSRL